MASKRSSTNRGVESPMKDDLKIINGIGPAVEKRLNGIGILTFAQLTALSPADLAAAVADLAGLSAERIIKQNWIGQARQLAAKSMQVDTKVDIEGIVKQHEPTTESLASEATKDMEVTATAVTEQINTFTAPVELPAPSEVHTTEATPSVEPEKIAVPSPAFPEAEIEIPDHLPTVTTESETLTSITASSSLAGRLRLREIELIRAESNSPSRLLTSDEPFDFRLTLDLVEMQIPANTPLNYKASLSVKGRGIDSYSGLAVQVQGTIIPNDLVTINVEGNTLPDGIYQLAAIVILGLPDMKLTPRPGTTAVINGGEVQFY